MAAATRRRRNRKPAVRTGRPARPAGSARVSLAEHR
jgi:hypothetical protein